MVALSREKYSQPTGMMLSVNIFHSETNHAITVLTINLTVHISSFILLLWALHFTVL